MAGGTGPLAVTGETPLATIVACLDQAGIGHMVVGSFASTYYGPPRTTQDIDLVVDITPESFEAFLGLLDRGRYYVPEDSARASVATRDQFNVIDLESTWKLDLIALKDDPFSIEQFARRRKAEIDDTWIFLASPEDTVLAKLLWARLGGSERQLRDVSGVLETLAGQLDEAYLDRWADELGVREVLDGLRSGVAVEDR
jgi:hypothetical protein